MNGCTCLTREFEGKTSAHGAEPYSTPEHLHAYGENLHRVETVFSILTTTFNIQRPRGRSLQGHVVRITTCIFAHTLSFFMATEV